MHNDFLETSVFHMKKPVRGHGHLLQTNKADSEIPWSSHYTECSVNLKSIRLRDKCSCSNHEKELCYNFIMELLAAKEIITDHHIFTQTFKFSLVCTLVHVDF